MKKSIGLFLSIILGFVFLSACQNSVKQSSSSLKKIDFILSFCLNDFSKRNCHSFSVTGFIVRIRNFQFFFPNGNLQIAKGAHIISGIVFCPDCLRIREHGKRFIQRQGSQPIKVVI